MWAFVGERERAGQMRTRERSGRPVMGGNPRSRIYTMKATTMMKGARRVVPMMKARQRAVHVVELLPHGCVMAWLRGEIKRV